MTSLKMSFLGLSNYREYLESHPFQEKLAEGGVFPALSDPQLSAKREKSLWESVNPELDISFQAEWDDLIRLHYLVTSRKATTILEFGVGKSTVVLDHALERNKEKFGKEIENQFRRSHPFQLYSVDNNKKWISHVRNNYVFNNTTLHFSKCRMSTINGRICTLYDYLPNICPDLIYLDGPDQFSPLGSIRGISTRQPDRLPMAGDLLSIEHFLLPGTLIVVDGRTANTRFLLANFQRRWSHHYFQDYDQHLLELQESPLGRVNRRQLEICLGDKFQTWDL